MVTGEVVRSGYRADSVKYAKQVEKYKRMFSNGGKSK
jgi:hypothetical protein